MVVHVAVVFIALACRVTIVCAFYATGLAGLRFNVVGARMGFAPILVIALLRSRAPEDVVYLDIKFAGGSQYQQTRCVRDQVFDVVDGCSFAAVCSACFVMSVCLCVCACVCGCVRV